MWVFRVSGVVMRTHIAFCAVWVRTHTALDSKMDELEKTEPNTVSSTDTICFHEGPSFPGSIDVQADTLPIGLRSTVGRVSVCMNNRPRGTKCLLSSPHKDNEIRQRRPSKHRRACGKDESRTRSPVRLI